MKKLYFILILITLNITVNAQISIGTEREIGVFMIDAASDDPMTGSLSPAHTGNNVFALADGRYSIGSAPNNTTFRVNGPPTIKDGTQAQDRLLVSDANGKASWKSVGGLPYVRGFIHSTGLASGFYPNSTGTKYYTGNYIDLPSGTFAVTLSLVLRTNNSSRWAGASASWMTLTLSDSPTVFTKTNDFMNGGYLFSGSFNVGSLFAFIKGMLIVKNSTSATKRYYLVTNGGTFPTGSVSASFPELPDNKFYAIRLND